jgi:hypothetical protein
MESWLRTTFGIESITPGALSQFVDFDVSEIVADLSHEELLWLFVYDIVEKRKYKNNTTITKPQKIFLGFASFEFAKVKTIMAIETVDLEKLWIKAGN